MTILYDRATLTGKARITPEGYFVADALVARANNIQEYRAYELGLTDRQPNDVVRVFRPEAEVFAVDSLKSASRLPITLDHPAEMVDAKNWKQYAKGETGEEILRDGEFMRVPIRVTDAEAVGSIENDRQEFSLGYAAVIKLGAGVHDGNAYDATATNLRYNHLAACKSARGGTELRITDERPNTGALPVTTLVIDGFPVNIADAASAKVAIEKLVAERDAAVSDHRAVAGTVAERDVAIAAKDAEIAGLTAKVATLGDPAAMRDAAASFARTIADAKRLGVTVTDAMGADEARKLAVTAKLGDKAAGYSAEQVVVAFDTLVGMLPADGTAPVTPGSTDPLAAVVGDATNVVDATADFASARAARFERLETGHRGAVGQGA